MDPVYVVVGKAYGTFKSKETGETIPYASLFTTIPFEEEDRESFHAEGLRADKFKVSDKDVIKDVKVGQKVRIFFNQYQKVNYVAPASAN